MQDIICSVYKNILRLSTIDKNGLKTVFTQVPSEIVNHTEIIDGHDFAKLIEDQLAKLTTAKRNKLTFTFLVEPQNVTTKFLTVNKKNGEQLQQVEDEIKGQYSAAELAEMYYTYEKKAPFLYQLTAVNRSFLTKYIEICALLGVELKHVIPWTVLLPKYAKTITPSIFIVNRDGEQIVSVSEFGGIFYTAVYAQPHSPEEISKLIDEISGHKRSQPITQVFTLNYTSLLLDKLFKVSEISVPVPDVAPEFVLNVLTNFEIDNEEANAYESDLLRLLPLPVEVHKSNAMVYSGAVAAVLLVVGSFLGFMHYKNITSSKEVLGDNKQSSQSVKPVETPVPVVDDTPKVELKRADLKIRVENAAGVSGLAARTRQFLQGKEYMVTEIDTADTTQEATTLRFTKESIAYKDLVLADLKEKFPNIVVEDTLDAGLGYSLLLLTGTSSTL